MSKLIEPLTAVAGLRQLIEPPTAVAGLRQLIDLINDRKFDEAVNLLDWSTFEERKLVLALIHHKSNNEETCFHTCASTNAIDVFRKIVNVIMSTEDNIYCLMRMIMHQSLLGYTCVHYCAIHNSVEVFTAIEEVFDNDGIIGNNLMDLILAKSDGIIKFTCFQLCAFHNMFEIFQAYMNVFIRGGRYGQYRLMNHIKSAHIIQQFIKRRKIDIIYDQIPLSDQFSH